MDFRHNFKVRRRRPKEGRLQLAPVWQFGLKQARSCGLQDAGTIGG